VAAAVVLGVAGPRWTMDAAEAVLYILVDFDNVPVLTRQKGADYVLHCALDAAANAMKTSLPRRVTVRLYGGWYDGVRLTRRAQDLVRSRYFSSPIPRCPTGFAAADMVLLKAELARTLLSRAGDRNAAPFACTYRTRPVLEVGFRTRFPSNTSCQTNPCFITELDVFFRTGECPRCSNHPDISGCVIRDEQKLVDVHLATDLLYLARGGGPVVLMSSDDDLWPAILQALPDLQVLVHVHTQEGGERAQYEKLVGRGNYVKTKLM